MRLNTARKSSTFTHEGGPAVAHISAEKRLRRTVLSCLLWEREFYEDGQTVAERIVEAAGQCKPQVVANLAVEARHRFNLRHAPLMLLCILAKMAPGTSLVSDTIAATIRRADEPGELLSLYWRDRKPGQPKKIAAQVKKGLARAMTRFDAYQLAKYNRDSAAVKLRDVLFLTHAKPKNDEQAAIWKQLADGMLPSPDTWEVALSGGADKRATFERLLREGNLGYLALLRNLRNMVGVGVDPGLMREAIVARKGGADRVLPFRYVAAARACPQMEPVLDEALSEAIAGMPILPGRTLVLVDVSGSMEAKLSERSDLTRMDAAAALASIVHGDVRMFSFSHTLVEVPPRRGMAGVDALVGSQPHVGTYLGGAVAQLNRLPHDRLIVITDEQSADAVPPPAAAHAYMINVASARNGVGYGRWTHIDGFSEQVLRFIGEHESAGA